MQERLREVGLRAIHQIYSNDVNEILEWQKQWGIRIFTLAISQF